MMFVDYISAVSTIDIHWNVIGYCLLVFYGDKLGFITKIANKKNIETQSTINNCIMFNDD